MNTQRTGRSYVAYFSPVILLLAVGGLGYLGYLGFLAFVKGILVPKEFASYGLVLTTLAAATASFFSPCNFTVLPSYLAFASSAGDVEAGRRFWNALKGGLVAALGVVTVVAVLGALIGALGTAVGPKLSITAADPNAANAASRALRITIGTFVLFMGLSHILNLSHKIPLLGKISSWAIRAEGEGGPSLRSVYGYGAGYVLVGIG